MSRENFISDNLVDMREKLRQNYAAMNAQMLKNKQSSDPAGNPAVSGEEAGSTVPNAPANPPEQTPEPIRPFPSQPLPPPLPRSSAPDELERSKRELEGALHRDHARLLREQELLQVKQQELERFFAAVTDTLKELEMVSDRRQLDLLRLRYLEAQGRSLAFLGDSAPVAAASQDAPRTMGTIFSEGLPYLIGALLSALIIALTIAFVF